MKLNYNPKSKPLSRKLRTSGTLSEALLWNELKAQKFMGLQFHRQKSIDEYIVDFYCKQLDLVIEIDGVTHRDRYEYDKKRQDTLESLGLMVLRFQDDHVKKDMRSVKAALKAWIKEQDQC